MYFRLCYPKPKKYHKKAKKHFVFDFLLFFGNTIFSFDIGFQPGIYWKEFPIYFYIVKKSPPFMDGSCKIAFGGRIFKFKFRKIFGFQSAIEGAKNNK